MTQENDTGEDLYTCESEAVRKSRKKPEGPEFWMEHVHTSQSLGEQTGKVCCEHQLAHTAYTNPLGPGSPFLSLDFNALATQNFSRARLWGLRNDFNS